LFYKINMEQELVMDKDQRDLLNTVGNLGALGFTLVLSTFVGLGLGLWIDNVTHLKPLFTIVCLLFGIIAGFVYIIYGIAKPNDKH